MGGRPAAGWEAGRKLDDGRPFGLIVGVNNHKKTIVFGASLLYDETAESFAWLFKTFLNVMSGKQPQTILTDEDAAMAKAIKLVLTKAHHRICVWHMNQNACKHLAGVVKDYKKFNAAFQHCTYDIEEEDEFLNAWHAMLNMFELQDNKWLERLFDKREHWALVYGRNTFSADMSSTQRNKRLEEVKCDFKATQTTPKLKAELNILRHASRVYTAAMFKIFQDQVLQTLNCDIFFCASSDAEKVLDINNVKYIPEHYIMKRWTIDAKALQITRNCNLQEDSKTILSNRYKELCRMFVQIAARAANSKESYFMAANCAEKLAQDVEKCLQIRSDPDMDDLPTSQDATVHASIIPKQNEEVVKPRGIKVKPKTILGSRRHVSGLDKSKRRRTKNKVQSVPEAHHIDTLTPIATTSIRMPEQYDNFMGHFQVPMTQPYMFWPHYNSVPSASPQPFVDITALMTEQNKGLQQQKPF
uniref:Protein FAR1-RELATED SEQUENCE n=1 Tax=Oryza sativa subsp. japonica TaxID=39947 RepID=Q75KP3_ORYSJ|nr:hypothetical protein [Oryza sativa Japonica Group]